MVIFTASQLVLPLPPFIYLFFIVLYIFFLLHSLTGGNTEYLANSASSHFVSTLRNPSFIRHGASCLHRSASPLMARWMWVCLQTSEHQAQGWGDSWASRSVRSHNIRRRPWPLFALYSSVRLFPSSSSCEHPGHLLLLLPMSVACYLSRSPSLSTQHSESGLCVVPSECGFNSRQQLAVDDGRGQPWFLTHLLFLQAPLLLLYAAAKPCCQRPQPTPPPPPQDNMYTHTWDAHTHTHTHTHRRTPEWEVHVHAQCAACQPSRKGT